LNHLVISLRTPSQARQRPGDKSVQDESKASVEAVICIPTFRRPDGVARTLQSLLAQKGDLSIAIVVI
jgi:hypothetical protein